MNHKVHTPLNCLDCLNDAVLIQDHFSIALSGIYMHTRTTSSIALLLLIHLFSSEGRQLNGIHFAMEFLEYSQKHQMGSYDLPKLDATGKHVVIIGGGDTGVDCIGTAVRQVHSFA